jgi:voltage-gated potassium channel
VSIIPLAIKTENPVIFWVDKITVTVFIIDYILRLVVADYKMKKGLISFALYPFTFMAIIDLVSILPSLSILSRGFRLLKVARLLRTLRVFRVFKAFRYSKNIAILINVFKNQKDSLMVVCWLAFGYVLITALVMFNVEPDTFDTFFDAVYWATVSLTTVGYGDIYATSVIGKIITMISSLFGIAIVALPAGIITAGYMNEIEKNK